MHRIQTGDIYVVHYEYQEDPTRFKIRPGLVILTETTSETLISVLQITGVPPSEPPKYFDRYKVPIVNWRSSGLKKQSWVRTHMIQTVDNFALGKYVGSLGHHDLESIINAINND